MTTATHILQRCRHLAGISALLCTAALTACADDEDGGILPPLRDELCELLTDAEGRARTLRFDDGREVRVANNLRDLTPDSIYRIDALISDEDDGTAVSLRRATAVCSPMPVATAGAPLRDDAVEVLTAWSSGRYINMRLILWCGIEASHAITFVDKGSAANPNGSMTRRVRMIHDTRGDGAYFRREVLVSCPVHQWAGALRAGTDSVSMTVSTASGLRTFAYTMAHIK